MRFDLPQEIPHELPRKRQPEAPPLEPSPVERLRASLNEQAEHPLRLNLPRADRQPRTDIEISHSHPHSRSVPHDQRPQRDHIPPQAIGLSLRAEELKVLADVGRFRVIATRDLVETVYGNRPSRMDRDLTYLRQQGLVQVNTVQARRDGRRGESERIEVVTLTRAGKEMAQHTSDSPQGQRFYAGLVKPREVEHDTQIYRAYQKEAERITRAGGTNLRVQLDFELKGKIQKSIYAERKTNPERDMNEIKQQVARQFELPYVNDGIQIPDARIEYDLSRDGNQDIDQGSQTGHQDIEVLTAAYRPGHLSNKAQAGFHVYASSSDRATLTAKVEGEHHLLDNILEL